HQELAKRASMQEQRLVADEEMAATTVHRGETLGRELAGAAHRGETAVTRDRREESVAKEPAGVAYRGDATAKRTEALKQQDASREAARQAMIYEAAKRRAEKKEAARKAAELVAAQKAAEKKVHHTSPETKELQNLLLQQIADIMNEKESEEPETVPPTTEDFSDLVIMDVHGEELQPESSAALEKKLEKKRRVQEQDALQDTEPETKLEAWGRMGNWFVTFCWMHIPLIGFWYMFVVAVRKKTPREKKAFARAFLLYRILVLILVGTILYICYRMGLSFIEQILSYMEAHQ
nr:hypothetical protein [Lachnospiraceae bacterium]